MTRDEAPEGFWEEHRGGLVEGGRSNTRHRKHCLDAGYRAGYAAGRRAALEEAAKECEKFAIFAKQVECPKHGAWLDKTHAVCGPCHEEALAELRSIRALLDEEKK